MSQAKKENKIEKDIRDSRKTKLDDSFIIKDFLEYVPYELGGMNMLHTKVPQIEEIIEDALANAVREGQPQLVSVVDRIDLTDPFIFFQNAAQVDQHRVFWRSAEEDFVMAGSGCASQMFTASQNRFHELQKAWNDLRAKAIVYDPFEQKGTGVVALGGFSFDSAEEEKTPWESFPDSQMTIPAFLLTNRNGESYFTTTVLIYPEDHEQQIVHQILEQRALLLKESRDVPDLPERLHATELNPEDWKASVKRATDDIKQGILDKVVLARELRVTFKDPVQIAAVLRELVNTQENSYIFAVESGGDYFIGATPERLVKVEDQQLVSTCLAGTTPRGKDAEEDHALGQQLYHDPKNRQEHEFVVRMIREAVEACCYNVEIPKAPVLYPLSNLQHLYTPVRATLENGYTLLDVVERLHPTPALGGMPQKASVTYIRENEYLNRGWYAGPIGWFDRSNNGEFAVAIRSALIQGKEASLFAGCGVVEDSDPEAEYEETAVKLKPMLSVLGGL
ncbi:isochorismate synthase [Halobacillus rhizosphaerae]|uniref:isochorismate synthase n=1 Tax=Halobacillus rhizosphaerae TaxID=3064889 RepID=UPI00398B6FFF